MNIIYHDSELGDQQTEVVASLSLNDACKLGRLELRAASTLDQDRLSDANDLLVGDPGDPEGEPPIEPVDPVDPVFDGEGFLIVGGFRLRAQSVEEAAALSKIVLASDQEFAITYDDSGDVHSLIVDVICTPPED
jgi:hypothetical protein